MADSEAPDQNEEIVYEVGHPHRSEVHVTTNRANALREFAHLKEIYEDDKTWITPSEAAPGDGLSAE
jgi:hypothetical protein